jgi:PIN domain nuclease of toxin-antitoxin system
MNLLTDTHTLAWWFGDRKQLSPTALQALCDPNRAVYVSVATAWEISIKVGSGRWNEMRYLLENFEQEIGATGFRILPIGISHVRAAGALALPHRDPFDRLLLAQAIHEGLALVTADSKLAGAGATIIWK